MSSPATGPVMLQRCFTSLAITPKNSLLIIIIIIIFFIIIFVAALPTIAHFLKVFNHGRSPRGGRQGEVGACNLTI